MRRKGKGKRRKVDRRERKGREEKGKEYFENLEKNADSVYFANF